MAMANGAIHCSICNEKKDTYECKGCLKIFCFHHLTEHRELINNEFNQFEDTCNSFRQNLIDQKAGPNKSLLIQHINLWEKESIEKIQRTADRCRQRLMKYTNEYMGELENKFNDLSEQIKQIRKNKFNEIDLNELNEKLTKLKDELDTSSNISIVEETTSFINKISIKLPLIPENEKFAKPGAYKELYCMGRHCAECGHCRDWYYTGDASSWEWIGNMENWKDQDWDTYHNDRVYERFEKRDGARCNNGRRLYSNRGLVDHACLCEDNAKDVF